jgi:4-hydroxybutyrate dehydrogenase/sulfolactaldehyde 3-reductase
MSTAGAVITAEALRLAESRGVSADVALSVVNGTIATNGHAKVHFPNKVLQGDLRPGFAVKHARKDIDIARTVMERDGFPCFVAPGALAAYDAAIDAGRADDDWSVLYEVVEEIWKKAKK